MSKLSSYQHEIRTFFKENMNYIEKEFPELKLRTILLNPKVYKKHTPEKTANTCWKFLKLEEVKDERAKFSAAKKAEILSFAFPKGYDASIQSLAPCLTKILRKSEKKLNRGYPLTDVVEFSLENGDLKLYLKASNIGESKLTDLTADTQLEEDVSTSITEGDEILEESVPEINRRTLRTTDSVVYNILGSIESVFREPAGSPTKSGYVENAKSRLTLTHSLDEELLNNFGESEFVWVTYFCLTNFEEKMAHDANVFNSDLDSMSPKEASLGGLRHAIAKIDSISENAIVLEGCCIQNKSPILGLDSLNSSEFYNSKTADYGFDSFHAAIFELLKSAKNKNSKFVMNEFKKLLTGGSPANKEIIYTDYASQEIFQIIEQEKVDFYQTSEDLVKAINTILSLEPKFIESKTRTNKTEIKAIAFDNLMVLYQETEGKIKIFKVLWSTHFIEMGIQHTKEWLDSLGEVLNLDALI